MHLLHVGLGKPDLDAKKLVAVFNEADDWLRYGANCWLLWTDLSAREWCNRLEGVLDKPDRRFLVCKLDIEERAGWLSDTSWKWIQARSAGDRRQTG